MPDLLKVIIPAGLALFGALVAAYLAHRRWKLEQQRAKTDAFSSAQRDAYKALWEKLEEVNLALREDNRGNTFLFDALKEANTLFLRNSLYLNADDQGLINRYIEALDQWRTVVYVSGNEDAASAFSRTWMDNPAEADEQIARANSRVTELRETLLARVRGHMTS